LRHGLFGEGVAIPFFNPPKEDAVPWFCKRAGLAEFAFATWSL